MAASPAQQHQHPVRYPVELLVAYLVPCLVQFLTQYVMQCLTGFLMHFLVGCLVQCLVPPPTRSVAPSVAFSLLLTPLYRCGVVFFAVSVRVRLVAASRLAPANHKSCSGKGSVVVALVLSLPSNLGDLPRLPSFSCCCRSFSLADCSQIIDMLRVVLS